MTLTCHRLPIGAFEQLACGEGDAETVRLLRAGQLSKRLLLIRAVVTQARDEVPEAFARAGVAAAVSTLTAAQAVHRDLVDDLLLRPDIGIEAMAALRRLQEPTVGSTADEALGLIGSLAVAAALAAELDAVLRVWAADGAFMVPGIGLVSPGSETGWHEVEVHGADRMLRIDPEIGDAPTVVSVRPEDPRVAVVRSVRATHADACLDVTLDDVSPGRARLGLPLAGRLDPQGLEEWRRRVDEGWRELVDLDPAGARGLAAGLTTVFPLWATASMPEVSASTSDGFGAMAATLPRSATSCALTLVHEFQHVKLSALLDLVPMLAEADESLHYAPWRADPRPLGGLLQGAYAYLGLVGFWDRKRRANGGLYAHYEFARWREEVHVVLGTLRQHGRLTPLGQRFIEVMMSTVERHRAAAVPAEALKPALAAVAECWTSWQLRNCAPADDAVARWAEAWHRRAEPPVGVPLHCVARPGELGLADSGRLMLTRRRLRDGAGVGLSSAEADSRPGPLADRLFVSGDLAGAAGHYKVLIQRDSEDVDAWTGLAMCRRGVPGPSDVLVRHPAAVRAVYAHAAAAYGDTADPEELARWML